MRIPIFGPGLSSKSPYVTAKSLQNIYAESRPQGEKASIVGYGTPGLSLFLDLGDTPPRGGLEFEPNSVAYVVHRGTFYEVNNAGVATSKGSLSTTSGRVSMAHNGQQVMVVDGTYGYIFSTLAAIGTAQAVASLTRSGTTATLTTTLAHGLVTGNIITLAGFTPSGYNGSYTVTVTGATTLTFVMNSDPGACTVIGTYTNPTFVQIATTGSATGFPSNPNTVTFLSGQFVISINSSGRFYTSGNANVAYDGLYWEALRFANAESNPDPIVAVWANSGQLNLLGTLSSEFWGNSGALDFQFSAIQGAANEWGLAARWSVAKYDNSIACLIRNRMGQVMVAKMNGYIPQKISTPDVDAKINGYASTSDATAYSYMLGGHPMYVISFPSAGYSWLYDGSTLMWSKLKSSGLARHRCEFSFTLIGNTIVADYTVGRFYKLLPTALTDNGDSIERELVSENIAQPDLTFLSIDCVRLDMEVGVGIAVGQGSNPMIGLSISRDNGKTWGAEMLKPMGKIGNYRTRIEWRRLGTAREFSFKFRVTDPVPVTFVSACVNPDN